MPWHIRQAPPVMTFLDIAILVIAGFAGGTVNAIAGGATFFTFPAMLATGIPPVVANASNALSLFPGSVAASWTLRRELASVRGALPRLAVLGIVGSVAGAILLLVTSDQAFLTLVPFLLLGATLLFWLSPRILRVIRARRTDEASFKLGYGGLAILGFCAVYGGYFGAGIGIIMLAGLALCGLDDIRIANALKNAMAALINFTAVVVFVIQDLIAWPAALVMMAGAIAGGAFGARISGRLPVPVFRAVVITVGSGLSAWYFYRLIA